jgi:hypothetical protein
MPHRLWFCGFRKPAASEERRLMRIGTVPEQDSPPNRYVTNAAPRLYDAARRYYVTATAPRLSDAARRYLKSRSSTVLRPSACATSIAASHSLRS